MVELAGVRFSKGLKTSWAQKRTRKAPAKSFGCFSKGPKNIEPEKYIIFPVNFTGTHYLSESVFGFLFSYAINKMASTDTLFSLKWPRPYIKREIVGEVRENDVVMNYGFYQCEIQ